MADFVDMDRLQRLQRAFADATELGVVTVDNQGVPALPPSHFSEFCNRMRADSVTGRLCRLCDAHGSCQAAISGRPYVYRCHAGLLDMSMPLVVDGLYVGAVLCGQVLLAQRQSELPSLIAEPPNPAARRLSETIPQVTARKVKGVADALFELSHEITDRPISRPARISADDPGEPGWRAGGLELDANTQQVIESALAADLPGAVDALTAALDVIWQARFTEHRMRSQRALLAALLAAVEQHAPDAAPACRARLGERDHRLDRWSAQLAGEALADTVVRALERERGARPGINELLNALARDLCDDRDLADAAQFLAMSPSRLSHSFKRATGSTFGAYKTARRVERAKLLLRCTDEAIGEIAAATGFSRAGYFTRVFRAETGVTPRAWRAEASAPPAASAPAAPTAPPALRRSMLTPR